jgi:surface antigen
MKKWVFGCIFVLAVACSALAILNVFGTKCSKAESEINIKDIGLELDSYKGVRVYNNGDEYVKDYGKNYSRDGYYYGLKWQCVEYVKRFYYDAKGHKMPDVYGHAKDFFDEAVRHGDINKKRGLVQYRNGENIKPEPDDLIVFTDSHYGHVAIVTEVTEEEIEVIQQNIYGSTRDRLKLVFKDGKYAVGGGTQRSPAGWLRKES